MEKKKKFYAVSVKEENKNTGNHSIAANDWRLKNYKYLTFNMNDGSQSRVWTKDVTTYVERHPECRRYVWNEVVDKKTGEKTQKCTLVYLISDSFIVTHNKV